MGGVCSGGNNEGAKNSSNIDKYLRQERQKEANNVKLLLLGAGESGKSTVAKQMKIIHLKGYSQEEKLEFRDIVFDNIFSSMVKLIHFVKNNGGLDPSISAQAKMIEEEYGEDEPKTTTKHQYNSDHSNAIFALWKDEKIKNACFEHYAELQLTSSTSFFLDNAERVLTPSYMPDDQDILRSRKLTSGIHTIEFEIDGIKFQCMDVGGQRAERRKWLHVFDNVTAVLFCAAMDEYDLKLAEDTSTSRVKETLQLFDEISNSTHLSNSAIILFLNKKDLFEEKIKRVDLKVAFPEYTGGKDVEKASQFLMAKFLATSSKPEKIYPHLTCATDTRNIQVVFNAVKDIILGNMLQGMGMMM